MKGSESEGNTTIKTKLYFDNFEEAISTIIEAREYDNSLGLDTDICLEVISNNNYKVILITYECRKRNM